MKLLIGGSPCTYWSIAQTKNRETEASGMGWELFRNYVIARDKFKPDYFLYENNKSMASAIREQITKMLGVEPICINSALVSAQNRQRLYWVGKRNAAGGYDPIPVEQPEDRGILLRDVLETTVAEKGYALAEPLITTPDGNSFAVTTRGCGAIPEDTRKRHRHTMVAEPVSVAQRGRYTGEGGSVEQHFEVQESGKTNTLTTVQKDNLVAEPVRVGTIESNAKNADFDSQQYRVYSPDGKSVTLCGNGGGVGAKTGLYAVPKMRVPEATKAGYTDIAPGECIDLAMENSKTRRGRRMSEKSNCLTTTCTFYEYIGTLGSPIYRVENGKIAIKDKQYPIKLRDGCYIIRKLTVRECMRLQTVPDRFEFPVSDVQAYKMLGNGWTVDVIVHLLSHFDGVTTEPLDVLSMYDGMACGRIALDKLGARINTYRATEIDKYAIQTAIHNFPDIVELGDAFQVREEV